MCGIAGIYWKKVPDQGLLEKTLSFLEQRGPDEAGIYIDSKVGLAHSRLSIIDLSNGKQPFTKGKNNPVLIFNGEIFNYRKLRSGLQKSGEVFETDSDTEVLYILLCRYGKLAVDKLIGQFAFSFYEPKTGNMLLGRDPFGEKPLYYSELDGFSFGSEIKALYSLSPRRPLLSSKSVQSIVSLWATLPNTTAWDGINAVPPGFLLSYINGEVKLEQYYSCTLQEGNKDADPEGVREHLSQAVKNRMVSDVPVGLYLSGGLDSSLVGYEVANHTSEKLRSFSVSFDNQHLDESYHQGIISDFCARIILL